jgi:HK97 family phage portal protein
VKARRILTAPIRGAKRLSRMVFANTGTGWRAWRFNNTRFNIAAEIGDGTSSSTVMAPILWIGRTFPEAPPALWKLLDDGTEEQEITHPLLRLMARPNPYYSGMTMWMATILDWIVSGNAAWLKVRDTGGEPSQLWWVPWQTIEPWTRPDSNDYITKYVYRPGGNIEMLLDPSDIVHFRYGIDPIDIRCGLSPLASVLREVFTDDEASEFTASLLRNSGVPGVVVSPDPSVGIVPEDDVAATKAYMNSGFTGDKRGEALILSAATRVQQYGFSPAQLNLRDLRRIPEERVTAVLGLPAMVAGLGAGLDRSTYANYAEAREAAYEQNIIPAQNQMSEEIRFQLLTDFEEDAWSWRVGFDLSKVRVLQEDMNKLAERFNIGIAGGWVKVSEGRRALGLETEDFDEVYLRSSGLVETTGEPRPEPPPPQLPPGAAAAPPGQEPNDAQTQDAQDEQAQQDAEKALQKALSGQQTPAMARGIARLQRDTKRLSDVLEQELLADFASLGEQAAEVFTTLHGPSLMSRSNGGRLKDALLDDAGVLLNRITFALGIDSWRETRLRGRLDQHYRRSIELTQASIAEILGQPVDLSPTQVESIASAGANRRYLIDIRGETRKALQAALEGAKEGSSPAEIASRIRSLVPAGTYTQAGAKYRAQMIAHAETMHAQRLTSIECYETSGKVHGLVAFDGTDDEECAARNGQEFGFDQARLETEAEHPWGSLTWAPVVGKSLAARVGRDPLAAARRRADLILVEAGHEPSFRPVGYTDSMSTAAPPKRLKDFDPGEARDEHGRWTDKPGGETPDDMFELTDLLEGRWPDKGQKALSAVTATHGYPYEADPISIKEARLSGQVEADYSPSTRQIRYSSSAKNTTQALLHELGHAIDATLARAGAAYESGRSSTPEAKTLRNLLRESPAAGRLRAHPQLGRRAEYWLAPYEMFARAYAQWVSGKQGLPFPNPPQKVEAGVNWSDEEFIPIAQAFDDLFRSRGILK